MSTLATIAVIRFCRALLFLVASAIYLLPGQIVAQTGGTIAGTVTDSSGVPIYGAEVTVDSASVRAFSDERGEFRLGGIAPPGNGSRTNCPGRVGSMRVVNGL